MRKTSGTTELKRIRSEIWHIGHNINQIARLTNAEFGATHEDTAIINANVDRCNQLIAGLDNLMSEERRA
ncbi:plasmid mobilization relaxosome protein MobC [uncultured Bifidobacterium sp.]|uniref:plasmid mobilization relaxosome protein MobC n=1 Tax=uncultured Bifidobacterium sp. TaxID=165187 RepID=UPI00258F424E|nr:plasmid mobilization relaxosome protein MobC [uncultured Bifidobacterium sp.]